MIRFKRAALSGTPVDVPETLRSASFLNITAADFIARTAYQMGKTPLLPIFAASLGASDVFLGLIVSVSTLTGMVLKPLIGLLSDRWGRRLWLLLGTAFFGIVPFFYIWVETPVQLFAIRVIHGTATAIYGPVTLAVIAEQFAAQRAEGFGWFGVARSGGYIIGPALAGWLLLTQTPERIFIVIGLMSLVAFIPILSIKQSYSSTTPEGENPPFRTQLHQAMTSGMTNSALWLAGGLEAITYVALYALKAFLPIYALSQGIDVVRVGLFFAVQEGVLALAKPFLGRTADRRGYATVIPPGMMIIAVALFVLGRLPVVSGLFGVAILLGLGQALIFPATTALIADMIEPENLGAGMGLLGTLNNLGKVVGPVIGGVLLTWMDYPLLFTLLGMLMLLGAILVWFSVTRSQRRHVRGVAE